MQAIAAVFTLLLGVAVILAGNGLLGTLLGVRGEIEGFSATMLGMIMSAYFAGFLVGTFRIPRLIRRIGHVRVFAALASLASVAILVHGLYVHPLLWLGLRFLTGLCIVGLYIVIESWLNQRTPNEQRGSVFSAYMTTTLIGLGAGQLILVTGDVLRLELFAVASVLLSLGLVPVAMTPVREPEIPEAHRLGLRKLIEISPLGVFGCVFSGLASGSFWGLGPVFASAIGLDKGGVAGFMAATIAGGIVMLWPVGRMSDRFERRKVLSWACILASMGALVSALVVESGAIWIMAGGFVYGTFAFSIYSLSAAHTNDHVDASHVLEVTSSLQLLWAAGAIAGPLVAGVLMQRIGPEALMLFIAVASLAPAGFAAWRMRVSRPIPVSDQADFVGQFATSPVALELQAESDGEPDSGEPR